MPLFVPLRRKLYTPAPGLEDIHNWRHHVLSVILRACAILGAVATVPSVLLSLHDGLWALAGVDALAYVWVVALWRQRSLSFRVRAWQFCGFIYAIGFALLFYVGAASEIYLMAFPVMVALLLGLRPAIFAMALNAVTVIAIGYLANTDLHLPGAIDAQPLLKFSVIALNFTCVSALITITTTLLLDGLEHSLEEKRDSEELYRTTFDSAPVGVSHLSVDGRWQRVNRKLAEMTGYSEVELLERNFRDVTHPEDVVPDGDGGAALARGEIDTLDREKRYIRKDGRPIWVHVRTSLVRAASGVPRFLVAVATDITERRRAEEKIRRLNRVYAVLSGINSLIVHVHDRETLYREACDIAVDAGRFRYAWIGVVPPGAHNVVATAWAGGDAGFAQLARPMVDAASVGRTGVAALAIAAGEHVVCNDIAADPRNIAYPNEALARGFRSAIGLPLLVDGVAIGAFVLYAGEPDFFDPQEIVLLNELARDIAFALDHIAKEEKLDYVARYDELTGVANATLFRERIDQFAGAATLESKKLAVVIIDIERFKTINDTFGRNTGDELLRQIADRITRATGDANRVARIDGDHFAAVFPDLTGENGSPRVSYQKYQEIFGTPFDANGIELRVAAKLGIAMFPDHGVDADALFRNAESALKAAQASGERYALFAPQMTERVAETLKLENKLRRALENEEFVLHYQPKVDLVSGAIVGVEALIRWNDPQSGLVPPAQFIPLLEETGMIRDAGSWALEQAVRDHSHWLALGLSAPRVAVNVSPVQLQRRDFVETVRRAIALGAWPPGIDLEITESLIMQDIDSTIGKLEEIRDLGITIFIDDFGTGYSSLSYLAKLPVQSLKIDRSFVTTMLGDPNAMTLVSTIVSLAHSLRLKVVAEGVDNEQQAAMLRQLKCEQMQGYLFSKPVPRDDITSLLQRGVRWRSQLLGYAKPPRQAAA